jgi:hypothetical protein
MCYFTFVKLKQMLVELIYKFVRLKELVGVVEQVVSRRVIHDGRVELDAPSPLVIDEFVHDFGVKEAVEAVILHVEKAIVPVDVLGLY